MAERVFRLPEVSDLTGLSPEAIAQMISRKQFRPVHGTRRGSFRAFTLRDIVHVAAIAELRAAGLSLARAVDVLGVSPGNTAGSIVDTRVGSVTIRLDVDRIAARMRERALALR